MRRLLTVTPGVSNVDVRAHEGGAAHGWDGTATSTGSIYLPAGELRFEFGTSVDPKRKARDDYNKRLNILPCDVEAIFVFATPRNWPGAMHWSFERTTEARFSGVKAIDAHVLEGWLQATPSVHYWISERLGYRPRDVQTIEFWWNVFQGKTTIPLPARFFTAGRSLEIDELRAALTSAGRDDAIVCIQAPWRDDALAFAYAALESSEDLLNRTVVVKDGAAWQRLVESTVPLILIPQFEGELNFPLVLSQGHRVILIAESNVVVRNTSAKNIALGKVDRVAAREALEPAVLDSRRADAMVALARRSMAAFFRSLAIDPRLRVPAWMADDDNAAIVAPLVLVGSWTNGESDLKIIEKLTGRSRDDVDRVLTSLAGRPDAPFTRSGGVWRLISPVEAALFLLPKVTGSGFVKWGDVASDVLLEPDPYRGMDSFARVAAMGSEIVPSYSETLKAGLAKGLALAASSNDQLDLVPPMQFCIDGIVRRLLDAASADETGSHWESLAGVLPFLAEASPDVFQDAVGSDLDRPNPVLRTMFKDSGTDALFGPSSPHPNLLWAIECLCWSPLFFGCSADLLARLSTLDPGGRLSNRPIESLQNILLGWAPQSGASVDEKISVVAALLQRQPEAGWKLALRVWPSRHGFAVAPHPPTYRDWTPERESVTYADWGRFIDELIKLVMVAVAEDFSHWLELIPRIAELPPQFRHDVIERLREVVSNQGWTAEERYLIWGVLSSEADRHEGYPDSDWAMSAEEVAEYRSIADSLGTSNDVRRSSSLFKWRAHVNGFRLGEEGYDVELKRLQGEALDEVLLKGVAALKALVVGVDRPDEIGRLLGANNFAPEDEVLEWLNSDDTKLKDSAKNFAAVRVNVEGIEWLHEVLARPALAVGPARELLMLIVPFGRNYWIGIASLSEDLQSAYWRGVRPYKVPADELPEAVRLLLEHGRTLGAVMVLSGALHGGEAIDIELLKEVLSALSAGAEPSKDTTMNSYYVGTLLEYMERECPDDDDLPGFEFAFFEAFNDQQRSRALYRSLARDSSGFVQLVSALYRSDDEPKRALTSQQQVFNHLAYVVIHEWRYLPGSIDGGVIDAGQLTEWVRSARLAFLDSGRTAIGDEQIGEILASSPIGEDGVWPAEAVRELIESIGSRRMDAGLHIGRKNRRGTTSRGLFDGGNQERALENTYREMAAKIATRWPRTARLLRGIADSYQSEARDNDDRGERRSDEG
jgi:hypothetical protein